MIKDSNDSVVRLQIIYLNDTVFTHLSNEFSKVNIPIPINLLKNIYLLGTVRRPLLRQNTTRRKKLAVTAMTKDVTRPTVMSQW